MNRREFLATGKLPLAAALATIARCASPTQPTTASPATPTQSNIPSRTFLPSLGGYPIKSFTSVADGYLYEAINSAGILIASRQLSSKDTENGNVPFSGNLIYKMLIDGGWVEPENGFNFSINNLEYYDPMTSGRSMIVDYYQMRVRKGDAIAITLPPKWRG